MKTWLTPTERKLPRPERRALRQARKLERWPDTNGRPPWLVRAEGVLLRVSREVAEVLVRAATVAVLQAATAIAAGGQVRHELALAALLAAALDASIDIAKEEAAALVEDTHSALVDDGVLE